MHAPGGCKLGGRCPEHLKNWQYWEKRTLLVACLLCHSSGLGDQSRTRLVTVL